MNELNYEKLYKEYDDERSLLKYKDYAQWTIPAVFPDTAKEQQLRGDASFENDYQSLGALLVNNLASKLASLLFPVTQSFFRLQPTEDMLELARAHYDLDESAVRSELIALENTACKALFRGASYAQLVQMLRYLIITGNALFKRTADGKVVVYSRRNYVQLRDNEGNVLDVILREDMAYKSIPASVRLMLPRKDGRKDTDVVQLYTRIERKSAPVTGKPYWEVSQMVDGVLVGEPSLYPLNLCPYNPVVWSLVNGDSNGRGLVEEHAGAFARISDLSRALALYEIDACHVVKMVKPGSGLDLEALNAAESGEWVQGDPQAAQAVESGDAGKIAQLSANIQTNFQNLAVAFMYTGNTRDAERVTAEEIRQNAEEAERTLGGVYSQLSQEIHVPLSYLLCSEADPEFVSYLVQQDVELEVIVGLPALGRSSIVTQLLRAVQELSVIVPTLQQLSKRFDTERIIDQVLQARGLDLEQVMLSATELKEMAQQTQQQAVGVNPLEAASTIGTIA